MKGATIEDGEFEDGELVGGEPVEGIDELERKLAVAEEQAQRCASAAAASEQMLARVLASGKNAAEQLSLVSKRVTELTKQLGDARNSLMSLAASASEKEMAALTAARSAEQAFGAAATAAQKWISAQRELKQQMDKTGKNERLKLILNDNMLLHVGPAGQAQAKLMGGRILLQRAESLAMLVTGLGGVASHVPGFEFDETHKGDLEAARADARAAIDSAREGYVRLAEAPLRPETAWVRKALTAYAYHMLAAASETPDAASSLLGKAAAQISDAVKGSERYPPLAWHVAFRDHLVARGAAPAPDAPAPGEDDGNGANETPPGDGG
jgi:hypothetical protein